MIRTLWKYLGVPCAWSMTLALANVATAQGPMPEEGATLFPNGALLSYSSVITNRRLLGTPPAQADATVHPTFEHDIPLTFSWSFRRDLQFTAMAPIVHRSALPSTGKSSATGLGDSLITMKYRFLRLDSERGTTQASFTFGPKLPTGSTSRTAADGERLPPLLQPGSGSLDWLFKLNGTYTGVFNIRRLVADGWVQYVKRTEGDRQLRMGDSTEVRFWLPYRPLQTQSVGGEWFIGPSMTWQRSAADHLRGIRQGGSGSDVLAVGVTTYVSPRGGLVFWLGFEVPVRQDWNGSPYEQSRRFNFGITKQFVLRP
jgi:hypothetical protein